MSTYELRVCDVQRAIIYTKVAGKSRPRSNMETGTIYTEYDTRRTETDIREQFCSQARGNNTFDGPIKLEVAAYRALKESSPRKLVGSPNTKKPDEDNILKIIQDALNHVAWVDDSQIFDGHVIKMPYLEYGKKDRLEIVITYYKVLLS